jgi:hypothetical protein
MAGGQAIQGVVRTDRQLLRDEARRKRDGCNQNAPPSHARLQSFSLPRDTLFEDNRFRWLGRRSAQSCREHSCRSPESIPDYLALVGDAADGYPGLPGWGAKSSAAVLAKFVHLESIPAD